jgi:hypothetical protein
MRPTNGRRPKTAKMASPKWNRPRVGDSPTGHSRCRPGRDAESSPKPGRMQVRRQVASRLGKPKSSPARSPTSKKVAHRSGERRGRATEPRPSSQADRIEPGQKPNPKDPPSGPTPQPGGLSAESSQKDARTRQGSKNVRPASQPDIRQSNGKANRKATQLATRIGQPSGRPIRPGSASPLSIVPSSTPIGFLPSTSIPSIRLLVERLATWTSSCALLQRPGCSRAPKERLVK